MAEKPREGTLSEKPTPEERQQERERLARVAEDMQLCMERDSLRVRDLVLAQPPIQLLGYLWAQVHMTILAELRRKGEREYRPNKKVIEKFQFALEYIHAVWSSTTAILDERTPLDLDKVGKLFDVLDKLKQSTMSYCMASSAANAHTGASPQSAETEFRAKANWMLIRGNRYQVLEEEFFKFILQPHDDALLRAYGIGSAMIAEGIQSITDSVRTGFSKAVETVFDGMEKTHASMKETNEDLDAAIKRMDADDGNFRLSMSEAMRDILYGGICNISRHARFSASLLEDLSYTPGGNIEFFADGEFKGTPMRTVPARIRPGIKIDNEYYITDGQFVRDAAYRAIQRGLVARLPDYRERWNERQKIVTEESYPSIFAEQLVGAKKYREVYFKDSVTGEWVETDLVIVFADVLLVVEAKAGVQAMQSPATNFGSHERVIRNLIIKAYDQCKRFVEYVSSAPEVPIFKLIDGKHVETDRLRQRDFRLILPIGLTVESFTPFSAMCKELVEIGPILGRYAFISMSVDDLFVLKRFLPTAGELFHYMEVRQAVGALERALIFDEIEHLGAYIRDNRFDMTIKEQLTKADMVAWDSFGDVVDKYFEGDTWKAARPPHQEYPEELKRILGALDSHRPTGWLSVDAFIRNLSGSARHDLAEYVGKLKATLVSFPVRRFVYGSDDPFQVWLCRTGREPPPADVQYQAQVASLLSKVVSVRVLILSHDPDLEIVGAQCTIVGSPSIIQANYAELLKEAGRQRDRIVSLKPKDKRIKRRRK